jgi:hypothetical protein
MNTLETVDLVSTLRFAFVAINRRSSLSNTRLISLMQFLHRRTNLDGSIISYILHNMAYQPSN